MHEFDIVRLKCDFHGLSAGTIGTIVHEYDGIVFEVEFIDNNGNTLDVLTTPDEKIELVTTQGHLYWWANFRYGGVNDLYTSNYYVL